MNPLKPRMGKKSTLCVAVLIWVRDLKSFSISLAQPILKKLYFLFYLFTDHRYNFIESEFLLFHNIRHTNGGESGMLCRVAGCGS